MKKCPYWKPASLTAAKHAGSFFELGQIVLRVLNGFPKRSKGRIAQVCGPITTGGFDSHKLNFLVFADAVRLLRDSGIVVFDQTPLEEGVVRLWEEWKKNEKNTGYCWPILEEIYLPILESGLIGTLHFLPGWENSAGTCWERAQGIALGIHVGPYPEDLYQKILNEHGLARPQ